MSEDVLLRFLSNGLIDVKGDDDKLERLRATAADLAGILRKSPIKAAPFALVAFDPQAPATDPVVQEALEALKKRWATYVNTFSGTPIAVVRAMLLDALAQAARDDDRIGVAFVTSARNTLPFMEAGNERSIWADVVGDIERRVDARAEGEWATPSSITVSPMSFEAPPLNAPKVNTAKANREYLVEKIREAAGPQYYRNGNVATEGNPHWPSNQPAQWVTEFSDRMATTVADVVDSVVSKTSVQQSDLSEPLRELAAAVSSHIEVTLRAVSDATAGLQRRANLLWWKEALYSPSARVSYRDQLPIVSAALMAFDLHQQVPTFSPASVAAFLSEAVMSLPLMDQTKTYSLHELVAEACQRKELSPLREAVADLLPPPEGRSPLLALIAYPSVAAAARDDDFRRLIGVPGDTPLTLSGWSMWVFRELQATRAATEGVGMKRRTRKA